MASRKEAVHQIKCLIAAVLAGLFLYAATALTAVTRQISLAESTVQMLQNTEQSLSHRIRELQSGIDEGGFDLSAERIAREKLGLVKPGERIFYSVVN